MAEEIRIPLSASEFLEKMEAAQLVGFKSDYENHCLLMVVGGDPRVYASPNVSRMVDDDYDAFRERLAAKVGNLHKLTRDEWNYATPN